MTQMRRRADCIGPSGLAGRDGECRTSAAKKEARRLATRSSAIHFAPIAQAHHLDRDALVVNLTDQPPVADPILPEFA